MNPVIRMFASLLLFCFFAGAPVVFAQPESRQDRTLSPYFFVKSDDPGLDQLPLKSTSVQVNITGVIADVLVTQVYKNEGKRPLEAIYIFPGSTRAAVYGMKMTIGERTLIAKIARREEARREYEDAKQAGKSASLLEQQRPNVFQMNVANILPSDVIQVELRYTELLVPRDAVYEFVYPTVVGPRYTSAGAADPGPREAWVQNPYFQEAERPSYTFNMSANVAAGLPVQEMTCPSHKVKVEYRGEAFSTVTLDPAELSGGNRDFILRYRLSGGRIETGLLLHEGEKENFFLLMMQPPKRVTERQIPPREYIFIVDVSGSMHGFPLEMSKKLLSDLIGNLRPTDRFNVLLFSGGSSLLAQESLPAGRENIDRALNMISRQQGGGGTELLPALRRAFTLPRSENFSRTVVIATDGYVSVEEQVFDLIRSHLGDANLFAFGIGTAVNRHIIEGMARVGMGEPFVITKAAEAPEKARQFREMILSPVLSGIKIDFGGFKTYDVEPTHIPDVLAERPVMVFGKWRGQPKGHIRLQGMGGEGRFTSTVNVSEVKPLGMNSALRYLWARHRVGLLSDYNLLRPSDKRIAEITDLGLKYNLLTAHTSFVAVDSLVRIGEGQAVTVQQPLPLPEGVSNLAVGNASSPSSFFQGMSPMYALKSFSADRRLKSKAGGGACMEERMELAWNDASGPAGPGGGGSSVRNLEIKNLEISGGLEKQEVSRLFEQEIARFRRCFSAAQEKDPGLQGEWTFTLVIGPDGKVVEARMEKGAKDPKDFEACVLKELKGLRFAAQKGRGKATVTMTFEAR